MESVWNKGQTIAKRCQSNALFTVLGQHSCQHYASLLLHLRIFMPTPLFFGNWNFRSHVLSLTNIGGTFAPGSDSLPNAISKTWSCRSPCFKCVFLSKVTRTASYMLNRVYRPTRLMPSHQSHETVPIRNRSRCSLIKGCRHAAS